MPSKIPDIFGFAQRLFHSTGAVFAGENGSDEVENETLTLRFLSPGTRTILLAALIAAVVMPVSVRAVDSSGATAEKTKTVTREFAPAEAGETDKFRMGDLLPIAWQKKPQVRFYVYTEMTPEGRSRPLPSPAKPLTYFSPVGKYVEAGWQISAGEKPPPWAQLKDAMQKALAGNGYNPTTDDAQRPDLLIVFSFGSFSTDIALLALEPDSGTPVLPPPQTAEELFPWLLRRVIVPPGTTSVPNMYYDRQAAVDVIERARFIGGSRVGEEIRFALHLEESYSGPADGSPVYILLHGSGGENMRQVLELAFHTCYFVTATAFDFSGVEKKQKQLLWQTRMTIEAQGVEMSEVLKPLIVNTGSFLGRETPEAVVVTKRLDRTGRVEVGEAVVVPDINAPAKTPEPKK